jgi:hypothetical protein
MYVHDYRGALIIAGMEVLSVIAANAWEIPLAGIGLPLMIAADLAGATWACDEREKGAAAPHRWRRFAVSAATLAVLVWIPVGYWPVTSWLAGTDGRVFCEHLDECGSADHRDCLTTVIARRRAGFGPIDGCAECVGSLESCRDDVALECPACFGPPPE